jgi:transcriptional regulator with XRE-family HTH domain
MPKSPDAADIYVGERIRAMRNEAGLSQTQLGDHLGVTFQQIQKYEKGSNRVSAGRLSHIASLFGVHVTKFYPRNGKSGADNASILSSDPVHRMSQIPRGVRLAAAFLQLDPPAQEVVLSVAEALVPDK